MIKKMSIISIFAMLIFLLTGCGNNSEVEEDYNAYKELYVSVINEVAPKDSHDFVIEKLNEKHVVEKIEQMNEIVARMSSNASTKREKQMLSNVLIFNEKLEFLQYVAKNKDNLTEEERRKYSTEPLDLDRIRQNIEEGEY
ncbi:hypothetical protein [Acetivibrio clariflavus]|uniref:hypothetical protein n=1 Tax=Acetivibrio clariflavus TaxID=288965 RepID=UPI000488738C|nr:hypothetical protein [Acetivibrio clariflavus]